MLEEQLKLLPKVDSFFKVLDPDPVSSSSSDNNSPDLPNLQQPSTSTASREDDINLKTGRENVEENVAITVSPVSYTNILPPKTQIETTIGVIGNDAGLWKNLNSDDIAFLINKGPSDCQHWNDDGGSFEKSKQIYKNQARYCSPGFFHATKPNGEKYSRDWLLYSPTNGRVYCFVCKSLSSSTSVLANDGFNDWRNPTSIKRHENSDDHRNASLTYLTRKRGSNLDSRLEEQIKKEQEYWVQVLEHVIGVICTLAERGLPFRGDTEKFNSLGNGNFLGLLELIAKFDPFLAECNEKYWKKISTRCTYRVPGAGIILEKIEEFEFMFMLVFWNRVLEQFHKTSKALQADKISFDTCAKLYASLALFLKIIREEFDTIERKAKEKLPDITYRQVNQRKRTRKRQINDGDAPDISNTYSARDLFRIKCFIPMVDALENNLEKRSLAYRDVSAKFLCLVDFDISNEKLRKDIQFLVDQYPADIKNNDFYGEIKHFHSYIKGNYPTREALSHQDLFKIIIDDGIQNVFPNLDIIFRIFLSLMVKNCSGERSFSRLKRIKNASRSTLVQEKLSSLSILCIESDKLRKISFDDIIQDFARAKSRKKFSTHRQL